MSRNKGKRNKMQQQARERNFSLEEILAKEQQLNIQKNLLLEKSLNSSDPLELMKAHNYIYSQKKDETELKSFLFNPDLSSLNTNNFRTPLKRSSYETLRKMARTPIIKTIIGTREDQVAGFASPVTSDQEKGWMIRKKKRNLYEENKEKSSLDEQKRIQYITDFIQNGGDGSNKWLFDSFEDYLRQMTNDSLTIDQICVENIYSRGNKLVQYRPIDGATIRLVDDSNIERISQYFKQEQGYWPKYVQVWQDQVYSHFYPWEMTFGVRNKVTDINTNGYGISELEDMINIVSWLLFGLQYNGNFFQQGSNPKGFFSIEGTLPPNALNEFKQMWRNTIAGVSNSHKVPVIESGSSKVNWIPMQTTNKDMEFDNWLEFLIVISCCMFKIDPTECGFNLKKAAQIFGQDGQKERLQHSQSKGLTPILKIIQRIATKYWVEPLDDSYEFVFCGVEVQNQDVVLDMDVKKIQYGFLSLEDGFKKYSGREFDPEKDTILNQVWLQLKSQQQMGGAGMNGMVDQMGGEEEQQNPFNPFEKSLMNYLIGEK